MVKILFNEKRIFLTDKISDVSAVSNAQIMFGCDREKLFRNIDLLMISEISQLFIIGDVEVSMLFLQQQLQYILAGGGLVHNTRGEVLLIYRRGKWDLPKGKAEKGESVAATALREVKEETGLQHLAILEDLGPTYHIYFEDAFIFKETGWFLMESDDRMLKPQQEEGIKKAVWVRKSMIASHLKNTYESIRDVYFRYSGEKL